MSPQTATKPKYSLNSSKHIFWIFEQYLQASQAEKLADALTLLFLADISFHSLAKTQKKATVEAFLLQFFQKENILVLVKSLFRVEKLDNLLTYAIVLQQDNHENRKVIFEWLHFYEELQIAEFIPVRFRFIPLEVEKEFLDSEKLTLLL